MEDYSEIMGLQNLRPKRVKPEDPEMIMELLAGRAKGESDDDEAQPGSYADENPYGPTDEDNTQQITERAMELLSAVTAGGSDTDSNPVAKLMQQAAMGGQIEMPGGMQMEQEEEAPRSWEKKDLRDALLDRLEEKQTRSEDYQTKVMEDNQERKKLPHFLSRSKGGMQ